MLAFLHAPLPPQVCAGIAVLAIWVDSLRVWSTCMPGTSMDTIRGLAGFSLWLWIAAVCLAILQTFLLCCAC